MITFKSFLNESFETMVDLIKKDCKFFLDESHHAGFLYRGMRKTNDSKKLPLSKDNKTVIPFDKLAVRQDRKPRHTDQKMHDALDSWLAKEFGTSFRSEALFCVGDDFMTAAYGFKNFVFPIGEFRYCWSPKVADFFTDFTGTVEEVEDFLNKAEYRDDKLGAAIESGSEIMIACKEYYALPVAWLKPDTRKALAEELGINYEQND